MPYIIPSPASSPPMQNGSLPSPTSSISFRLDSSDSLPTLSSQCSSSGSNSEEEIDRISPASSPPTPDTGLPSSIGSSPMKAQQQNVLNLDTRPFRNHIRSHSHDAISGLHATLRQQRRESSDSSSGSLIYLQPASPHGENGILISKPVVTETSPRTKTKLSLFDLTSPESTDWPEGESTEDHPDSPLGGHHDLSLPWTPPILTNPFAYTQPSSTSAPEPSPSDQIPSRQATPKPRPQLHPKTDLRIDVDRLAESSGSSTAMPTPMVRKKSGELVRSSLKHNQSSTSLAPLPSTRSVRAKSAPATPTGPKNVHFDKQLEHVKLFLAQQRPAAVSRQGSPGETTEEESEAYPFPDMSAISAKVSLVLPNFPPDPSTSSGKDVFLQSLELLQDTKMLRGVIVVKNICFHKRVVVRFTTDDWQTISETTAEYSQALEGGAYDQWIFKIKLQDMLARIEEKKMLLAIKYVADHQELWDNNDGRNYVVQFKKEQPVRATVAADKQASKYQWSVTTANQASERMADLRKVLDRLVNEDTVEAPHLRDRGFQNRYDFGAALKQHPGRTASAENVPSLKHSQPYFHPVTTTGMVGGMPATTAISSPAFQPRRYEKDGIFHTDYGIPSQFMFAGQQQAFPSHSGLKSPPIDREREGRDPMQKPLYSSDEIISRSDRYNSFPPHRWDYSTVATPRLYEDTYISPYPTRPAANGQDSLQSSKETSRESTPPVSPRSGSPVRETASHFANGKRPRSPPPRLPSPDFSTPESSENSYSSPQSPAVRLPDEPSTVTLPPANGDGVETYSGFLEKYCFFQPGREPSALGLVTESTNPYFPPSDALTPRACATSYRGGSSGSSNSSRSVTPANSSPIQNERPFESLGGPRLVS